MKKPSSLNPHLCPDCARMDCGWWNGLHPPKGAKTDIRQIREYEKGSRKRVTIDRVIVMECPNFRRGTESPLGMKKEPCHELANAIILTAVKDYRSALRTKNKRNLASIRRFFRSDYFSVLSNLDGKVLIKKLDEEVKNDKTGT